MNYCSIQDAWGSNFISDQYKSFNKPEKKIETFSNPDKEQIHFNYTCDNFIEHLKNCKTCKNKIYKTFNTNNIVEKFTTTVDNNRDVIVLILIAISFMVFMNLLNSFNDKK